MNKKPQWFGRPASEVVVIVVIGAVIILLVAGIAEWMTSGKGILGQGRGEPPAAGDGD